MKLSKNLSLKEVIKSNTAIKNGIDNSPTLEHLNNLEILAEKIFQPIREHFGVPIGISSGYRSKALNKAIPGSSKTSQHCSGQALDLDADIYGKVTNREIFDFIVKNLDFDQVINEFNYSWIHVSYNEKKENRKQVLKAYKENGRTKYGKV